MAEKTGIDQKLKLSKYENRLMLRKPDNVNEFDLSLFDTEISSKNYDFVVVFVFSLEEMKQQINEISKQFNMPENGYLYITYPKKGNKEYHEFIDRDSIFPYLDIKREDGFVPDTDYKFSRMLSLNDVFTMIGLKCIKKRK